MFPPVCTDWGVTFLLFVHVLWKFAVNFTIMSLKKYTILSAQPRLSNVHLGNSGHNEACWAAKTPFVLSLQYYFVGQANAVLWQPVAFLWYESCKKKIHVQLAISTVKVAASTGCVTVIWETFWK